MNMWITHLSGCFMSPALGNPQLLFIIGKWGIHWVVYKGGLLDYICAQPAQAPARPLSYQTFREFCVKMHTRQYDDDGAIVRDHMLDAFTNACSRDECIQHCINFLETRLALRPRAFYIGITHSDSFRWGCQKGIDGASFSGHKWDRDRKYTCMFVLLKCRGWDLSRLVEETVVDYVYSGRLVLTTPIPAVHLIINKKDTPAGTLSLGPDGEHYVYCCV